MPTDFIEQFIATATKQRTLRQGNYLFHQGDPVHSIFAVEKGQIELTRYSQDGISLVLQ
ncbi:cyclic nucleotide-binding domain-containing protein, partial [Pseudomonadota bacterium]